MMRKREAKVIKSYGFKGMFNSILRKEKNKNTFKHFMVIVVVHIVYFIGFSLHTINCIEFNYFLILL